MHHLLELALHRVKKRFGENFAFRVTEQTSPRFGIPAGPYFYSGGTKRPYKAICEFTSYHLDSIPVVVLR